MRSGVHRSNTVAWRDRSNDAAMQMCVVTSGRYCATGDECNASRAGAVGRADSKTGHCSAVLAAIDVVCAGSS